jgi:hypothetical protein
MVLVGLLSTLSAVGVQAQTFAASCPAPPASAKGAGDQAMLANRHAEALACYEAAYRFAPSPALLYNQARALEFQELNAEALRRLLLFQRSASEETRRRVPQLQQLIDSLTAEVAELRVECSVSGASVSVNQEHAGRTPLSESLFVDPGNVQVQVHADRHEPYAATLPVSAGERRVLHIVLAQSPAVAPQAPESRAATAVTSPPSAEVAAHPSAPLAADRGAATPAADDSPSALRLAGWSALGVGAAGAVLAGVSYGIAASRRSEICAGASECSSDDYDAAALDAYDSWRRVYTASWIVAGLGLATGGVLLYVSVARPEHAAWSMRVTPGGVLVTGRF